MSEAPVALVTGGGTGIGAACCRALAREGGDRSLKLTIDFRDHGRKKILPSYTKLQVET